MLFPSLAGAWLTILLSSAECDSIVVTSTAAEAAVRSIVEQSRAYLSLRGIDGYTGPRIAKIPLGVDASAFIAMNGEDAKRLLGVPPDAIAIAYLGRLTPQYKADLEPLIRAFRTATLARSDCHLILAGSEGAPGYAATLMDVARENGCAEQVRVVTNFPRCMKPVLLAASDIIVSPADNVQESFGLNILEAMAAGRPVVASDWSGYRDLVRHGETGLLVDTALSPANLHLGSIIASASVVPHAENYFASQACVDVSQLALSLRTLAGSAALRQKMGAAARVRACECYDWRIVIRQFEELWREQIKVAAAGRFSSHYVDLTEVFKSYASHLLRLDRILVRATHTSPLSNGCRPDGDDLRSQILRRCERIPVPARDLMSIGDADNIRQIVLRLLKSGHLEVAGQ